MNFSILVKGIIIKEALFV